VRPPACARSWSEGGDSAKELALFTARALGELVSGLALKRESPSDAEATSSARVARTTRMLETAKKHTGAARIVWRRGQVDRERGAPRV
jgi:hypothetical protein